MSDILQQRLKLAMQNSNISGTRLASLTNNKPQAISGWLSSGQISKENLVLCANILGTSVDWLLGAEVNDQSLPDQAPIMIGAVIRRRRKAAGMSQLILANEVPGYDHSNLSRFERGAQSIPIEKLQIIANSLKTTLSSLFYEMESKSQSGNDPARTIGDVIRLRRRSKNISQKALARCIDGYCHSDISRIEAGKQSITIENLQLLANALETSAPELLQDIETDPAVEIKKDSEHNPDTLSPDEISAIRRLLK